MSGHTGRRWALRRPVAATALVSNLSSRTTPGGFDSSRPRPAQPRLSDRRCLLAYRVCCTASASYKDAAGRPASAHAAMPLRTQPSPPAMPYLDSSCSSTIIVGAGIIGLSTAYYLSESGNTDPRSIHLVDSSPELFRCASGLGAGFLVADCKPPPHQHPAPHLLRAVSQRAESRLLT